ncbi:ABC transporter substrate-binding protein [Mycolicibacter arupensis]|jgi:iron complex transport system substrate-binding protein|uniref:ABC transporter substrate-binding protein n=1 Tax=Mycolicibacter arupensis TaxID=342002 RepID=A0A0F5MZJ6_9MYCO|nr:ABC transporter substrate-binding protein [Mycolicibacter arupensis]KAA1432548.1 ABC transporter substrate-binding protein [Mycolicibacter arupensis]KKC00209.1 iron ABC transporter substrate-binding protein [Mycolicibacter arupensis]MCV7277990.1 ABC transporter substrate-binding protein [Mycolicibacter arupensis]OQZ99906.1 iron ABC transporter substrate-binding protein [Mycolicibacter arupensis]TXI60175.1 MAG: ABC transporter substrate-binding protein [Mycolicibacter arupensis]
MSDQWSRRGFLGLCGAAGAAALLTSCSSNKHGNDAAPGPVTITHLFGETTVPEPPRRVVCAGYTGQDDLLALGVVPIAVTEWFGDQPFGVWPWARRQLGDAKPAVLTLADGIAITPIADLKPDLIIATNAGVDAETYKKLSAIAPTVPQSGGPNAQAFFEPWKVQAAAIGTAVHRGQQMQSLVDGVDAAFTAVAAAHPGFAGKKVLLLDGRLDRGAASVATGWRTAFLGQMGLTVAEAPPLIEQDRLGPTLRNADVLIWTTESDDERSALLADPEIAACESRSVFTTKEQAGAIAFASPLSYPVVAAELPALIATITG